MKQRLLMTAAIAGVLALPVSATLAQDAPKAAAESVVQQQDQQFATKAAADNMAELELARVAQQRASGDEVKDYAATLLEDHQKAGEELKKISEEQKLTLPSELPPEAEKAKEELSALSGDAFDRAYVEQMITDHEKAVQLFEEEAAKGQNEALKQFASSKVQTLRMHLDRARQLEREMGEQTTAGAVDRKPDTQPQNPLLEMTSDDLIGKKVVNQEGDEVGEIEEIVIGTNDKVVQAIVSVGGFLGIGEKSVAVSFDELQPGREQAVLLTNATVEELKQRPAYDEASGDYERYPPDKTPAGSAL